MIETWQTIEDGYELEISDITVNEISETATDSVIDSLLEAMNEKMKDTLTSVSASIKGQIDKGIDLDNISVDEIDLSNMSDEDKKTLSETDWSSYDFTGMTVDWDKIGQDKKKEVEDMLKEADVGIDLDVITGESSSSNGTSGTKFSAGDIIKTQIKKAMVADNTLVLFAREGEADPQIQDTIDEMLEALDEEPEESMQKQAEELAAAVKDVDNMSDDEVEASAKATAEEIKKLVNGESSDDAMANQFMDQVNSLTKKGWRFGLWKALYIAMKVAEKLIDISAYIYCIAITLVIALYFTAGVLYISLHVGGLCIIGVGISLICLSIQNIIQGVVMMQKGANSANYLTCMYDHCKGIMDSVEAMYAKGIVIELVIGVMLAGIIPVPFVGIGTQTSIGTSLVKYVMLVAALAAYVLLLVAGLVSNLTQSMKPWNSTLGKIFEDGDDLLACFLAAGVKLTILLSFTKTLEAPCASTGVGLLIPIGP